ncbi:RNA polymerase II elongation factor ELL2-like [Elephas maximus indicus]|uniref:RNA polymerase II elongation factor ELL2-like n=1 Tax=Elephas maximus indicus TaxID=99487 RepID=UPI002116898C|nr:RNA polymerase II elongation factor ELL2-like [Elephas maximus indicus]
MTAFGGRIVGAVAPQEGEVTVELVNDIEPWQDNVTMLPMQLTGPTIQAIDSYQNYKNTAPPKASIQFQGLERLIEIPSNSSPTDVYHVNFQLSSVSNDNHQGRVDHTQQTEWGPTPSQLTCQGLFPEKMTVRRTNTTHGCMAQVEEDSSDKLSTITKPYVRKKVPVQKAPQTITEPVPEREKTTPIKPAHSSRKSRIANSVHMRPYRDRVIHLLALRDYKKPELLVRLQKDGILKKDKNSLGKILQQVATLNPRNFSYTLKDFVFKELQRDWPGYSELDRQSLELVLARQAELAQNTTATNYSESSRVSSTDGTSQKQLFNSTFIDPLRKKKVRISHLTTRLQSTSNVKLNNAGGKSAAALRLPSAATASLTSPPLPSTSLPISNSPQPVSSNYNSYSTPEGLRTQDPYCDSFCRNRSVFEHQQDKHTSVEMLACISIQTNYPKLIEKNHSTSDEKFKYKFIEHQAKNQKHSIEMMEMQKIDPARRNRGTKSDSSEGVEKVCTVTEDSCSTSGPSGYLANYFTIVTSEQRQHYVQEFRAEYDEYQALRAKLVTVSSPFVNLDAKRKNLSPGTKVYQDISEKISLEYQKIKQSNPNFDAEKERCWYLYNKLAHIKRLIRDFDQKKEVCRTFTGLLLALCGHHLASERCAWSLVLHTLEFQAATSRNAAGSLPFLPPGLPSPHPHWALKSFMPPTPPSPPSLPPPLPPPPATFPGAPPPSTFAGRTAWWLPLKEELWYPAGHNTQIALAECGCSLMGITPQRLLGCLCSPCLR